MDGNCFSFELVFHHELDDVKYLMVGNITTKDFYEDKANIEPTLNTLLQWAQRKTKFLIPWPLPKKPKPWKTLFAILKVAQEKYEDSQELDVVEEKPGTIKKAEGWYWEQLMRLHSVGWSWFKFNDSYFLTALKYPNKHGEAPLIRDPDYTWEGVSLKDVLQKAFLDVQKRWTKE